jgi:thiol-disulfide isomerase/thioredoxin
MVRTLYFDATYHWTRRVTLTGIVPVRMVIAPKDFYPGDRRQREFKGLGDVIFLSDVRLNLPETPDDPSFRLQAGLRTPTGESKADNYFSGDLSRDPVLQAGHGTWDPIFGLSWSQRLGGLDVSANAITRITGGENKWHYKYANELQSSVGVAKSLAVKGNLGEALSGIDVGLRLHGVWSAHDYDKGVQVINTGGRWLYLIPAVNLRTQGGGNYFFQFQLPVYQYVNGSQLVADYSFTTGVSYTIGGSGHKAASAIVDPSTDATLISTGERVEVKDRLASGQVTVVEFYADWCQVCRRVTPKLQALAAEAGFALRKVNIGDGSTPVAKQYGIRVTPTFQVFDASGTLRRTLESGDLELLEQAVLEAGQPASN